MKKTLITLLAMATCAMGAEYNFAEIDGMADSYNAATVGITLNVAAYKEIGGTNFGGANEVTRLAMFTGTWSDASVAQLGVASNGSGSTQTSMWTAWNWGGKSGNATTTNLPELFNASTNWDNITDIAIVYSFDSTITGAAATVVNTGVSIRYTDGGIDTYTGTASNVVFSGVYKLSATGLTTNDTYVKTVEIFGSSMSEAGAGYYSSVMIPEPATATLSLLALAGLAARRRRK